MQFQIGLISSYSSYQWPSWGCCAVFGGGYAFLADLLWIGGCRGCGMHWCLAWLAGWLAGWLRWARGQAPSSVVLVVCADFGGVRVLALWFIWMGELRVKYILMAYFSRALMFAGFFIRRLGVCRFIGCILLAFDFIANWYCKKQRSLQCNPWGNIYISCL